MDDIRRTLKELGLNDKEIVIYLMLLQVGTAPASVLGDRTRILRSSAQYTCKQLEKKGLVTVSKRGTTLLYTPDGPEKILELIERERGVLAEKEQRAQQIVATLHTMTNPLSVLPKMQFSEGRDGALRCFKAMENDLEEGMEILSFYVPLDPEDDEWRIGKMLDHFDAVCMAKKIRSRWIAPRNTLTLQHQKTPSSPLEELRLVDPSFFECGPSQVILFKNKMFSMTIERGSIFTTITESASIVALHRGLFEISWQRLQSEDQA